MQSQKMGREAHLDSDNHAAAPPARGGFSLSLKMKCICFLARPRISTGKENQAWAELAAAYSCKALVAHVCAFVGGTWMTSKVLVAEQAHRRE